MSVENLLVQRGVIQLRGLPSKSLEVSTLTYGWSSSSFQKLQGLCVSPSWMGLSVQFVGSTLLASMSSLETILPE